MSWKHCFKEWWSGSSSHRPVSGPTSSLVRISKEEKDEFDPSLDLDACALAQMTDEEVARYREDLIRRRTVAHNRELTREQ